MGNPSYWWWGLGKVGVDLKVIWEISVRNFLQSKRRRTTMNAARGFAATNFMPERRAIMKSPRARCWTLMLSMGGMAIALTLTPICDPAIAKDSPSDQSLEFDAERITLDAQNTHLDQILRIIGAHADFVVEATPSDDPTPTVTTRRSGNLQEIIEWLLRDYNHILVYDKATDDSAQLPPRLAHVILLGPPADLPNGARVASSTTPSVGLPRNYSDRSSTPEYSEGSGTYVEDLEEDSVGGILSNFAIMQGLGVASADPFEDSFTSFPFVGVTDPPAPMSTSIEEVLAVTTARAQENLASLMDALEQVEFELDLARQDE